MCKNADAVSKIDQTGDHRVSETQSPCWSGGWDGTSEQKTQTVTQVTHDGSIQGWVSLCVCLYLGLCVGLQSEEAAHLSVLSVNDSSSNKVCRIGIHPVQQSYTKTQDLQKNWPKSRLKPIYDYMYTENQRPSLCAPLSFHYLDTPLYNK